MITLILENYCQMGCRRFEPNVRRGLTLGDPNTYVKCKYEAECAYMLRYLTNHYEEENEDLAE